MLCHAYFRTLFQCCDHPYLVDKSLQSLLVKDLELAEYLDVGVKASGKLQLLDTMLSELKNLGSRVIILFQVHVFRLLVPYSWTLSERVFWSFMNSALVESMLYKIAVSILNTISICLAWLCLAIKHGQGRVHY